MKNKVRFYRLMRDRLTQEQLAREVGVSRQTIIAMERGRYNPSVELALRLAGALDVRVEDLFVLEEDNR